MGRDEDNMFCLKCGEAIPDGSEKCPLCGAELKSEKQRTGCGLCLSKEPPVSSVVNEAENNLKIVVYWSYDCSVCSFIFLSMNYMSVSIKLLYYGSSDTNYTGYYLTKCLGGTARLSGLMVILLIIVNIATIITAIIGIKGSMMNKDNLRKIILIEDILYIISTVVPLFHMMNLLKEFDSSLSSTGIGIGCYLNIAVAVFMIIMYFLIFSKKLHA
jgi:hypothetical protein